MRRDVSASRLPPGEGGAKRRMRDFANGEALRANPHRNPSPIGEGQALMRVRRPRDVSVLPLGGGRRHSPFSLGEKVACVARRMRASSQTDEGFFRGEGALRAKPSPRPSPRQARDEGRGDAQALVRALIARRAGVRVSRRKLNRDGGRRPAGHGHGDKKKQQILHSPQTRRPPSTLRRPKAPDRRRCQGRTMAPPVHMRSERDHTHAR